jgi:hypothetical protein
VPGQQLIPLPRHSAGLSAVDRPSRTCRTWARGLLAARLPAARLCAPPARLPGYIRPPVFAGEVRRALLADLGVRKTGGPRAFQSTAMQ